MKSETAENLEGRVDVLINAVYNIITKIKRRYLKMKAKIYEGRIYSVIKEKMGISVLKQWTGCIRVMQNSKRQ